MRKKTIFNLVIAAILSAMAVVLQEFGIKIPLFGSTTTLRISFYGLPLMIAGIIFGIKTGFLAGFLTAFISQIILSDYGITPTTPLWMLAAILFGALSGIIVKLFRKSLSFFPILLSVIVTSILVSLANSLALYVDSLVFDYSADITFVLILARIVVSTVMGFVYTPCLYFLAPRLKRILE